MKKPSFAIWATLIVAVALIGICAAVLLFGKKYVVKEGGAIELRERKPSEIIDVSVSEPTPEPEPTEAPNAVTENAVDIILDAEKILFTLASETDAKMLLEAYLSKAPASCPEGERFLSAEFVPEIFISPAEGKNPQITYTEAIEQLIADPQLLPVRMETEKRTTETGTEIQTETLENEALAKGSRMVVQIGRTEKTEVLTNKVYIAGECVSSEDSEKKILFASLPNIIQNGKFEGKNKNGEPGKKDGPRGKDAQDISLKLPIRVMASSYFGMRDGEMHNGMDLPGKAGTEIIAPAEGVVTYAGERGEYGFVIDIDHGNGFVSRLSHCADVRVELSQRVYQDEVVAVLAEAEDSSEKPHLHYELLIDGIPYNPMHYFS